VGVWLFVQKLGYQMPKVIYLCNCSMVCKFPYYQHFHAVNIFLFQYFGDILLETLPYTFANLRSLFLSTHFEMYAILSTFCLLRNAPNLEELEIAVWTLS
jgi:hypothetical protein